MKHRINLSIHAEGSPPIINPMKGTHQIISNLLSNAIKFTPDGAHPLNARQVSPQHWPIANREGHPDGNGQRYLNFRRRYGIGITPRIRSDLRRFEEGRIDESQYEGPPGPRPQQGLDESRRQIWVESEEGKGSASTCLPLSA